MLGRPTLLEKKGRIRAAYFARREYGLSLDNFCFVFAFA